MAAKLAWGRPRVDLTPEQVVLVTAFLAEGKDWTAMAALLGVKRQWLADASRRVGLYRDRKGQVEARAVAVPVVPVRAGMGKDPLPAMSALSVAVLREAGLPIRAST